MRAVLLSIFLAALVSLVAIPPLASALTFTRPLAFGSSGTDVSALQQYLQTQGYFHYPDITGYFGPYTWRALAAFQWDNKLEPVGYVGPKSELALNKLLDQSLASIAPSTPAAPTATSTISLSADTAAGSYLHHSASNSRCGSTVASGFRRRRGRTTRRHSSADSRPRPRPSSRHPMSQGGAF